MLSRLPGLAEQGTWLHLDLPRHVRRERQSSVNALRYAIIHNVDGSGFQSILRQRRDDVSSGFGDARGDADDCSLDTEYVLEAGSDSHRRTSAGF